MAGHLDPAVQAADLYLPARGGPVLARLYRERGAEGPQQILLWLHGGGFIGGSVYDLDYPCSALARLGGVLVVSLEYRLAPEHPFPEALYDTCDAMCWLADDGRLIGGNGRLAAGGQSPGAALAAGFCAVLSAGDHAIGVIAADLRELKQLPGPGTGQGQRLET